MTDVVPQEQHMCRVKVALLTDDWYQSLKWYQGVDSNHRLLAAVVVHHQTHCFLIQRGENGRRMDINLQQLDEMKGQLGQIFLYYKQKRKRSTLME